MRVQVWKAQKFKDSDPDYMVYQRQRLNDGTTGYDTVRVGYGYKQEAPSGETYLALTIKGFNDNKPKT